MIGWSLDVIEIDLGSWLIIYVFVFCLGSGSFFFVYVELSKVGGEDRGCGNYVGVMVGLFVYDCYN